MCVFSPEYALQWYATNKDMEIRLGGGGVPDVVKLKCGNTGCKNCEKREFEFKTCSICLNVKYPFFGKLQKGENEN